MSSLTYVVGWTLIHFVWQGAILAMLAGVVLWLCRGRSANIRYAAACVGLATMLAAPGITAYALIKDAATVARPLGSPHAAELRIGTVASPAGTGDDAFPVNTASDFEAWLPVIVLAWLAGVVLLSLRMAGGLWHVHRLHARALEGTPSRWQPAAQRIAAHLGLRVDVHVAESSLVDVPAAIGWLRPVILLPLSALANLTPAQVEAILAHELHHIGRKDFLVNVVQTVAETLLFFHPAVWWLSGRIRAEREHCCDDIAVRVCGDPIEYAAALTQLEAGRSGRVDLALAATDGSLIRRVRRLLNVPVADEGRSVGLGVTLGMALLSLVVMGAFAFPFGSSQDASAVMAATPQVVDPIASPGPFDWRVHSTTHFDVYYYPTLASDVGHVSASVERAYQRVSSELQHNLAFRVPLVLFKTRGDFAQQSIVPGLGAAIGSGDVSAFSEPTRNRMAVLVEAQPDRLNHLLVHELTHIFAFDVIPRPETNARRPPAWIDEGLADYMTGVWDPKALADVRDRVTSKSVPTVASLTAAVDPEPQRLAIHFGQAFFDFIEAEYGKPAIWQLLMEVRRSTTDGGDFYRAAFNRTHEEIDAAFGQYLQRRFMP